VSEARGPGGDLHQGLIRPRSRSLPGRSIPTASKHPLAEKESRQRPQGHEAEISTRLRSTKFHAKLLFGTGSSGIACAVLIATIAPVLRDAGTVPPPAKPAGSEISNNRMNNLCRNGRCQRGVTGKWKRTPSASVFWPPTGDRSSEPAVSSVNGPPDLAVARVVLTDLDLLAGVFAPSYNWNASV
jgi:hypothetical protein